MFEACLRHFYQLWTWYIASLSYKFLIYKLEIIIYTLREFYNVKSR